MNSCQFLIKRIKTQSGNWYNLILILSYKKWRCKIAWLLTVLIIFHTYLKYIQKWSWLLTPRWKICIFCLSNELKDERNVSWNCTYILIFEQNYFIIYVTNYIICILNNSVSVRVWLVYACRGNLKSVTWTMTWLDNIVTWSILRSSVADYRKIVAKGSRSATI